MGDSIYKKLKESQRLFNFLHVNSEETRQDIVVLRTECQHDSCHSSLNVEGEEDDPVVANTMEETLTAQY